MKFSLDGAFLAVAGGSERGAVLRVWRVRPWGEPLAGAGTATAGGTTPTGGTGTAYPNAGGAASGAAGQHPVTHGAPLFDPVPFREYLGHETHIVDVAWSRSNLLLSASMDAYARLWHVSRPECLHKFQHPDCVTAVDFHPTEDNYFLSGCLDRKLRIWSLETGRVVLWQPTPSMITAAAFSPDARLVAVGLYNGTVHLYRSDGLQYYTTLECRNRSGKHRRGRRVTGLEFSPPGYGAYGPGMGMGMGGGAGSGGGAAGMGAGAGGSSGGGGGNGGSGSAGGSHLLISTNDSRVRLVTLDDFSTAFKYAGADNANMQIRASFDWSGDRVISGSEDRRVVVWRRTNDQRVNAAGANGASSGAASRAGGASGGSGSGGGRSHGDGSGRSDRGTSSGGSSGGGSGAGGGASGGGGPGGPGSGSGTGSRVKVRSHEWFVADDGVQPGPGRRAAGDGSDAPGCCCAGPDATRAAVPPVVPRPALLPVPQLPLPGAAGGGAADADALAPGGGAAAAAAASAAAVAAALLQAPDPFEDLEARAELQAYYGSSGRIATQVALFAPAATLALARPFEALAQWKRPHTLPEEPHDVPPKDPAEREAWMRAVPRQHFIIVTADSRGFVRVYEDTSPPYAVR